MILLSWQSSRFTYLINHKCLLNTLFKILLLYLCCTLCLCACFFCFVVGQVPMIKPPATLPERELLKGICKINFILHKNIVRENLKCLQVKE